MGTNHNVLSSIVGKGGSESTLRKALDNANEEMIKLDPKGVTKQPTVVQKKVKK